MIGVKQGESRELLRLLRNEEQRAREKNPLERIMRITTETDGLRVETTTEKLVQRLGRCLRKARGGEVSYKWSHNNKYARVVWEKENKKTQRGHNVSEVQGGDRMGALWLALAEDKVTNEKRRIIGKF